MPQYIKLLKHPQGLNAQEDLSGSSESNWFRKDFGVSAVIRWGQHWLSVFEGREMLSMTPRTPSQAKIMLWDFFSAFSFHRIERMRNGVMYHTILDKNLLPSTRSLKMGRGYAFNMTKTPNISPRQPKSMAQREAH